MVSCSSATPASHGAQMAGAPAEQSRRSTLQTVKTSSRAGTLPDVVSLMNRTLSLPSNHGVGVPWATQAGAAANATANAPDPPPPPPARGVAASFGASGAVPGGHAGGTTSDS